jgi:hypothetical protein
VTLAELLDDAAAELTGLERGSDGRETIWSTARGPFAATDGSSAQFRLRTVVARAAFGTPDTHPSRRGVDWVAFRPPDLDRFALDRAAAWFASAAILAGARRR